MIEKPKTKSLEFLSTIIQSISLCRKLRDRGNDIIISGNKNVAVLCGLDVPEEFKVPHGELSGHLHCAELQQWDLTFSEQVLGVFIRTQRLRLHVVLQVVSTGKTTWCYCEICKRQNISMPKAFLNKLKICTFNLKCARISSTRSLRCCPSDDYKRSVKLKAGNVLNGILVANCTHVVPSIVTVFNFLLLVPAGFIILYIEDLFYSVHSPFK